MSPYKRPLPPKKYLLLHEGRRGLKAYRFETKRDVDKLMGLTVHEDLSEDHRGLLVFLGVFIEHDDHIILQPDPAVEGEW